MDEEEEEEVTDLKLQLFHNTVREHIVSVFLDWIHPLSTQFPTPLRIKQQQELRAQLSLLLLF